VNDAAPYVLAVIFVATLIRSSLGFGEALVAVPLLALRIPVTVAAPLAVLVSIAVAAAIVVQDRQHVEFRSAGRLVVATAFGVPFGVLLLAMAHEHVVKLALGGVIVAFAVYSLTARTLPHLERDHTGLLAACGVLAGILGGAYGMNGPPLVVYGTLRRWAPRRFRATLQGYFLPASVMGAIGYLSIGLWTAAVTRYFLWSLPGVVAAILIGRAINARLDTDRFIRVVHLGLLAVGAALIAETLTS